MIPCSSLLMTLPLQAAETMVVTADTPTETLDNATHAAEQQATLGSLGKRRLIDVPWSVQTQAD